MDPKASQLTPVWQSVVDETSALLQHPGEIDEAGQQAFAQSQGQAGTDPESESPAAQAYEQSEDELAPKGMRFALLFTCILLGSFFIGYVRVKLS